MIVTLLSELFEREETDRLALLGIMDGGRQRYRVQLRPAYRAKGDPPFHQWLNRQDPDLQKRILPVFERGLRERDFGPAPMIDVHCFGRDEWQNDPKKVPIRLCIDTAAEVLIRPLRLLLENGRNDWGFLDKVVPDEWKDRWQKAVRSGWIEQDVGGGITELRKFIETHVATNEPRRLRT